MSLSFSLSSAFISLRGDDEANNDDDDDEDDDDDDDCD